MDEKVSADQQPYSQSPMSEVYGYQKDAPEPPITGGSLANNQKKQKNIGKSIWEFVKILLIALVIVLPIRYFLFQPFIVKGDSMIPNFHSGDYLIVDEISYRFSSPQRGDVVVLKYPLDMTQRFIKRIIGLPRETVQVQDGKITITKNKQPVVLNEKSYLPNLQSTDGNVRVTLGQDQYFVLGDNRPFSYDSRRWGILPGQDIIGKALLRVYPPQNISYFTAPAY